MLSSVAGFVKLAPAAAADLTVADTGAAVGVAGAFVVVGTVGAGPFGGWTVIAPVLAAAASRAHGFKDGLVASGDQCDRREESADRGEEGASRAEHEVHGKPRTVEGPVRKLHSRRVA